MARLRAFNLKVLSQKGLEFLQHLNTGFCPRQPMIFARQNCDADVFPASLERASHALGLLVGHNAVACSIDDEDGDFD
jgi:hypothetical protein